MSWKDAGKRLAAGVASGASAVIGAILGKGKKEKVLLELAKAEFSDCAGSFSGLYEQLYRIGKTNAKYRPGVIEDWTVRTEHLTNAKHYAVFWTSRFKDFSKLNVRQKTAKVNELLSFILDVGIRRDPAARFIVDGNTYKKYSALDDDRPEAGCRVQVIQPYWRLGETILEKGIIKRIECEGE
jgi:hypothetical protein